MSKKKKRKSKHKGEKKKKKEKSVIQLLDRLKKQASDCIDYIDHERKKIIWKVSLRTCLFPLCCRAEPCLMTPDYKLACGRWRQLPAAAPQRVAAVAGWPRM